MKINIFLLCYNEELIIENTINHYKNNFPNSTIYIINNFSTDNSVKIALDKGCNIINSTSEKLRKNLDDVEFIFIKNNYWKKYNRGWTIICDMDELLDISEKELEYESKLGNTIISTLGIQMVGESTKDNLSDIKIEDINKGFYDNHFNKTICFNTKFITDINFSIGAHSSLPYGIVKFTNKKYHLKHYNYLGENYYINKILSRYKRKSNESIKYGWGKHYIHNVDQIKETFKNIVKKSVIIKSHNIEKTNFVQKENCSENNCVQKENCSYSFKKEYYSLIFQYFINIIFISFNLYFICEYF